MIKNLTGAVRGKDRRVAVVASRFNHEICDRLLNGALRGLKDAGVADEAVVVARVPGAVEIPIAAQAFCDDLKIDAVVALGAVIRGDTSHYDYVCKMAADGVLDVMLRSKKPVAFGVLTCDDEDQALARSGPGADNKGYEAARTALELCDLLREIRR